MVAKAELRARSHVTSKGQTTIPKQIRDQLGYAEGTQLEWILENGRLSVAGKTRNIADFAGLLGTPHKGRGLTVEEMDDAIAAAVVERFKRKTRS